MYELEDLKAIWKAFIDGTTGRWHIMTSWQDGTGCCSCGKTLQDSKIILGVPLW